MTDWCSRTPFHLPLHYTAVFSERAYHRELRKLALPRAVWPPFLASKHARASTHFFEHSSGKQIAIVTLPADTDHEPIQIAALLVHEAVHIWQEIKLLLGEKEPSTEFEAYTIQGIAQQLMYLFAEGKNR